MVDGIIMYHLVIVYEIDATHIYIQIYQQITHVRINKSLIMRLFPYLVSLFLEGIDCNNYVLIED